jgi:hypothetical protein
VCSCFEAVRGVLAVASQGVPSPLADAERLERGPAFDLAPALREGEGDWPALLHDSARSARGPALKNAAPREIWRVPLETGDQPGPAAEDWRACANYNGPISAPVVAGNLVLVSAPDAHRLYAVNAATGAKTWTFTAGARIDTPPTVAGGRVYAGCRDGYVYCLELATGKLAWRFLAARTRRHIVAYDQLESAWPIHGALVVEKGLVLATAGYHPETDGGIHCWGLDAATGAIRWQRVVAGQRTPIALDPARNDVGSKTYFSPNRVLNSLPNSDGEFAVLPGLTIKLSDGTGKPVLGETAQPKGGKSDETGTGLMISRWGLVGPWLRSKDGEFDGPGPVLGRQYIGIPGAEGRRFAWDSKRLLHIALCDTSLLVLDRSVPYGPRMGDHKLAVVGQNVPGVGKALAVVKQTGAIHDYSPYGRDGFDPVAMLLAGDQAVVAWAVLGEKMDIHARPQATLQFIDVVNGKIESEVTIKPGVIEHGLATARGRLFMSLEDGSLAAFE